jgi:ABC-type multidrug transport system fused ATPase/permease subunit
MTDNVISLRSLVRRFWKKVALTWLLVTFEGVLILLFPLVIGWAVDDLLEERRAGIVQLGVLCVITLTIGGGRRFYDTRIYSGIYRIVSNELVHREKERRSTTSTISARTNLFTEFIEFMEHALPGIINNVIGFAGTVVIIFFMNTQVFLACLAGTAAVAAIYALSEKKIFFINRKQNDEFERQVDVIVQNDPKEVDSHFRGIAKWYIKLSDLETRNFSLTWLVLSAVLLYSIVAAVGSEGATYGQTLSIIMYVFGFMESIEAFPEYYQEMIRLREITSRLG